MATQIKILQFLLVTADKIGEGSGGLVADQEFRALRDMGYKVMAINPPMYADPFESDAEALRAVKELQTDFDLAHFYAGTFSKTVAYLQSQGTKVTYTCAAHDVDISRQEFEKLGMNFNFPHLRQEELFDQYVQGYRDADLVITPSTQSYDVLVRQGVHRIKKIPHGCNPPEDRVRELPDKYRVGYLGASGPDKGLIYLIQAWAKLNYNDSHLSICGRGSEDLIGLVRQFGKGAIHLGGFLASPSILYNSISVYVQPSATEGFGMEVLEAMAHGRPVICSTGAGAADCIEDGKTGIVVPKQDSEALAEAIDFYHKHPDKIKEHGQAAKEAVKKYDWDLVRKMYIETWKEVL